MAAKETYLRDTVPLTVNGTVFDVSVYEKQDGRRHAYFALHGGAPSRIGGGIDNTRVGYRVDGGEAMFLGMMVQPQLRGHGMGGFLVEHFFSGNIEPDAVPCETAFIHKPVIALTLARAGLKPACGDFAAEILPQSKYSGGHIPKIQVLSPGGAENEIVTGSSGGPFYEVVDVADVERQFPMGAEEMVVALHTRYLP